MSKANLDDSLAEVLKEAGDLGKYQCLVFILLWFSVLLTTLPHTAFIFITENLDYRCEIPECDATEFEFEPKWLKDAVPYKYDKPRKCERYQFINSTNNNSKCSTDHFDQDIIEYCDHFVYKAKKASILVDFNLHCDQNLWKLTLVGTINSFGQFIGIPTAGFLSDRYGRRTLLVIGCVSCGIFGILRAFSNSYVLFVILEFLDALVLSCTYACSFILGVELVGPEKRVIAASLGAYAFAFGEVLAASVAWLVPSWRVLLLIFYAPLFLFILYLWLVPESIRWLLSQGRYEEVQEILKKIAKVNKKNISQTSLDKLSKPLKEDVEKQPFSNVFKSRILVIRLITSSFCWITCAFLFYGLSINSIALTENSYLNFIFVSLIEIPAYILTCLVVDRIGRRWTQFGAFSITAVSCFVFIFIDNKRYGLTLFLYLLGKFGSTSAFTIVYLLSSEIFPTNLRHSLMGLCSMFARIGSMVAPQVPLLSAMWTPLPLVLFSGMAAIAALLTLSFPETTKLKLPDTIEEAENIGKKDACEK